ncbi:hypothetical protein ACVWY5_008316 [Bradyrhizobium sp. USDA 3256]
MFDRLETSAVRFRWLVFGGNDAYRALGVNPGAP